MKSAESILLLALCLGFAPGAPAKEAVDDPAGWWSLRPLVRPRVPERNTRGWSERNAIDSFILARLASQDLAPAPEAERRVLIRRLYYDLIGLPPSPDEVAAFVADPAADAYERLVDRLLASPRHGERWARHWMDAAHFAETHGHDQDRIREHAWPYRDYLIGSFNAGKPYARFIEEQVAGDVLHPDDPLATVALGFLAGGPWDESSLRDIREETLDRQIGRYLDRDDMLTTVFQTFTSTSVQCARCHDHKTDPVPQRDYYALQAVFAGIDRANRHYDADPEVHRRREELRGEQAALQRGDRGFLRKEEMQREVSAWEEGLASENAWTPAVPETFLSSDGAGLARLADGSLLAGGPRPERDTYTITTAAPLAALTAIRLEAIADPGLPSGGPGRQDNGNFHLTEVQLLVFEPGAAAPKAVRLRSPTADFDQDGWTIAHAIDGDEKTAWGIFPKVGESHQAVFELESRLEPARGARLAFIIKQLHGGGHTIGRLRLSVSGFEPARRAAALPAAVRQILAVPAEKRDAAQRDALAAFVFRQDIERRLAELPPPSMVYAAASDFEPDGGHKPAGKPRPVFILQRGEITHPMEPASPGALACVTALPSRFQTADPLDESARRAALARWLTDAKNPLTWRSIVNRAWHHHFGRGLAETLNDFGRMGSVPSHPELLDWLGAAFRDDMNGSLKELHRLMVTSAAYRQASISAAGSTPGGIDPRSVDGDNRLLWRMQRARLDAEEVRDAMLAISGRLELRMGGPSDRQFDLRPGLHVTPSIDYARFDVDSPAGRRRSVYRFLFRTLPDPLMDALDCPAGDFLTPARQANVTPQQALALWNSALVARLAEHLAARLEKENADPPARVRSACEWTWGRPPDGAEERELGEYASRHGLANLCRLLFNSNEFIFVN